MNDDPFAPLRRAAARRIANAKSGRISVAPVPADAPSPPVAHPKLGKPSATWTYTDATGAVLGYELRFDGAEGKQFRPLTLWRTAAGGKLEWQWATWPPKRPLYGLQRLAEKPGSPVVVCEGEKAADAATRLLSAFVTVTSPNGSKSAGKADWSPLRGRAVTVWPDADAVGLEYAQQVARFAADAGAASVAILSPPEGVAVGWDAADALVDGWNTERAAELISAAKPIESKADGEAVAPARRRRRREAPPQRDKLIGLTDTCEFWHDAYRTAYVTFGVNAHYEHWPVRSREFRMWLSGQYYKTHNEGLGGQGLEDGIRILEARAVNDGPECEPFLRIGRVDGKLYLDLSDHQWRAVEIDAGGWRLSAAPPIKFLRSSSSRQLPEPEAGGLIEELRCFVNLSDDDFMLSMAWVVAAMRERGPYPILVVNGQQGAGKSNFSRMIRSLIDPSAAPIRAVPKDDRQRSRGGFRMPSVDSPPAAASRPACCTPTERNRSSRQHAR
jgi:putative DNA primase/helicase